MRNKIILALIIFFAFFIRIFNIGQNPPSLNWDEVSHGYNAYSVLKTGADEWGKSFPTIFRAYGDYKLPVYIYTTVPSIAVFGLNALGVRLPSVLAGTFLVLFIYLLSDLLFKNKKIALFSAFLIAIEPWSFFMSRIALEANLSLFLIVSGVYFLIYSIKNKSNAVVISSILLIMSMWTYNTARVFVPMLVILTILFNQKEVFKLVNTKKFSSTVAVLIFSIFTVFVGVQLLSAEGGARYKEVAILNEASIGAIEHFRNTSNLPTLINKIIHNRYTYFSYKFISNYFSYFSFDYLFKTGGDNYQFNIQNHGLLYAITFPLVVLGFISGILDKRKRKFVLFLFGWGVLAPIIPSLTRDAPHALRNIVFIPVPVLLSALGLEYFSSIYKKFNFKIIAFVIAVYLLSFAKYISVYTREYRQNYSWAWQYGYQQAAEYAYDHYEDYEKIIVSKKYGEPHEFFLFYGKFDPQKYNNDENLIRFYQTNWYWVDAFDKFYFINEWDIPNETSDKWVLESDTEVDIGGDVLLITSPNVYPQGWTVIETIYFLDGTKAFEILKK